MFSVNVVRQEDTEELTTIVYSWPLTNTFHSFFGYQRSKYSCISPLAWIQRGWIIQHVDGVVSQITNWSFSFDVLIRPTIFNFHILSISVLSPYSISVLAPYSLYCPYVSPGGIRRIAARKVALLALWINHDRVIIPEREKIKKMLCFQRK